MGPKLTRRHRRAAIPAVALVVVLGLGLEWLEQPGMSVRMLLLELLGMLLLVAAGAGIAWLVLARREE